MFHLSHYLIPTLITLPLYRITVKRRPYHGCARICVRSAFCIIQHQKMYDYHIIRVSYVSIAKRDQECAGEGGNLRETRTRRARKRVGPTSIDRVVRSSREMCRPGPLVHFPPPIGIAERQVFPFLCIRSPLVFQHARPVFRPSFQGRDGRITSAFVSPPAAPTVNSIANQRRGILTARGGTAIRPIMRSTNESHARLCFVD